MQNTQNNRSPSPVSTYGAGNLYVVAMIKTRTFENTEALIAETEALLRKTLEQPGNLMLSGGTHPLRNI